MWLFGNKNKITQINSNNSQNNVSYTSFERMQHFAVHNNSQKTLFEICDTIKKGRAVLVNFDKIKTEEANYMLAFISGVVYALDGENFKVENKMFLFGTKEVFEDGSLYAYIEETK